jgi:hypothetical protein
MWSRGAFHKKRSNGTQSCNCLWHTKLWSSSEEIIFSLSPFQGQEDDMLYWIRLGYIFASFGWQSYYNSIIFLKKKQRPEPRSRGLPNCKNTRV